MSLHSFHRVTGPALGVPLMSLGGSNHPTNHSSVFGDVGSTMRSIFDPFNVFGAMTDLSHDIIRAPVDIAHEASTAFTGGITAVGNTVSNVAGSLENTASSILSSPLVLVGGAALVIILLSR